MANVLNLGLRGVQFLLILLITALVGNAIAEAVGGNPSGVNFAIFVAVWCWLTWIVGTAADFTGNDGFGKIVGIADIVSALLTIIAGIVLAAKLGVHSCGNKSYLASNGYVNGSHHRGKRCHELQASTAFFFFLFATYCVTAAFSWKNSSGGIGAGGLRKGAPSMRQV